MALQGSGPISLLDVATEFGGAAPHSINEYYGRAPGIPASGVIALSDFYGKANEVTLRIYPSAYGGQSSTDLANASDGNLNTYSTHSVTGSGTGSSIRTSISSTGSLEAYGEYYVKSLRVYTKVRAVSRAQSSINVSATNQARVSLGTTSTGTVVIDLVLGINTVLPIATTVVQDQTANAQINAKVNTLYGYTNNSGLNLIATYLEVSHGGYAHTSWLYEHFYDLTLSGSPPV